MKYMLLCYDDEAYWNQVGEAAHKRALDTAIELTHVLDERGEYLLASPLQPVSTATSVRVRDGKPIVTAGPFAETREVLGGFYLIDVDDLDQAIAIAAQHPGVDMGTVEIRPVVELSGFPQPKVS